MDVDGPGRITHIWITVDNPFSGDLILRIWWDGEDSPSVEATDRRLLLLRLEDTHQYISAADQRQSLRRHEFVFPDALPPSRQNHSREPQSRAVGGSSMPSAMKAAMSTADEAYFHAKFNRSNPLAYMDDYVILDGVRGHGHYVGTQMCWQQNTEGWWGEGEIKAFIDGDSEYPTYCGTGNRGLLRRSLGLRFKLFRALPRLP